MTIPLIGVLFIMEKGTISHLINYSLKKTDENDNFNSHSNLKLTHEKNIFKMRDKKRSRFSFKLVNLLCRFYRILSHWKMKLKIMASPLRFFRGGYLFDCEDILDWEFET